MDILQKDVLQQYSITNKHLLKIIIILLLVYQSPIWALIVPFQISSKKIITPYYNYTQIVSDVKISDGNWLIYLKPEIVSSSVGKNILGTEFTRNGLNGRFTHSYLQYKNDDYSLFLGRSPLTWGQSNQYSIIQSGSLATYDQFRFELKLGKLKGEILTGQLGSENLDGHRITRLIGGHRLTGLFFKDKLQLQLGEQIIYTGENRKIELFYLNPAVPYVFAVYDSDDLNVDGFNNDNGMIFLNGRYKMSQINSVFFEFIMDDYQIHNNPIQDMLGWKLGFECESKILNNKLNWETEYTQIDSWTYIHHGQFTNWQNRGHAIGYPYGPDLRSFYIHADTWIKDETIKFDIDYTWLEKGANNINSEWGNNNTLDDPFPSKPVKVFHLIEASVLYKTEYFSLQTGYTNKPFPYEIANGLIDELKGGFFLSASLHYQMDINLKE